MIVVGLVVLAGGGFLFHEFFWQPLQEKKASIQTLNDDVDGNEQKLAQAKLDQRKVELYKSLSLPPAVDVALREYENYLTDLLIRSGFNASNITVTSKKPSSLTTSATAATTTAKRPNFTPLQFNVDCPGKLENLVRMLEGFYHTGLLHEIKLLSIEQGQLTGTKAQPGELTIKLTIEALIVTGAEPRKYLLPNVSPRILAVETAGGLVGGPAGLGWAGWAAGPSGPLGPGNLALLPRRYSVIADKNIFVGPTEMAKVDSVNVNKYVFLTDITRDEKFLEGHLFNRWEDRQTRLRKAPGLDFFTVRDNNGAVLVSGTVVDMDDRELVFQANDKLYRMHVGQNIDEALKQPVSREEVNSKLKGAEKITVKQ
jgi:hypothetical protein